VSVGRSYATSAHNNLSTANATAVLTRLTSAVNYGVFPAAFWKGKLLLEGWGDQSEIMAERIESLKESQRLFDFCESSAFHTELAKSNKAKVATLIAATYPFAQDPHFLLSLHGFSIEIKKAVIDAFPTVLLSIITRFVQDNVIENKSLFGPPVGTNKNTDWLLQLREKVLCFQIEVNESKEKGGGQTAQSQIWTAQWMNQTFNTNFIPNGADESLCSRWTVAQTTKLLAKIKTAADAARAVCDPCDGKRNPVTVIIERLVTASMNLAIAPNTIFLNVHSTAKKVLLFYFSYHQHVSLVTMLH
jgi:hypothetical protein